MIFIAGIIGFVLGVVAVLIVKNNKSDIQKAADNTVNKL